VTLPKVCSYVCQRAFKAVVGLLVLSGFSFAPASSADPKTGMICVIPDPPGAQYYASVPFDLNTLMFKIDDGKKTPWPQKAGFKIEGLSLSERHLVVVYSSGKPIQSFRFRFTDYKETEPCLLFDGYGGPDLRHLSKLCHCT
jgi:hypothetical protein